MRGAPASLRSRDCSSASPVASPSSWGSSNQTCRLMRTSGSDKRTTCNGRWRRRSCDLVGCSALLYHVCSSCHSFYIHPSVSTSRSRSLLLLPSMTRRAKNPETADHHNTGPKPRRRDGDANAQDGGFLLAGLPCAKDFPHARDTAREGRSF